MSALLVASAVASAAGSSSSGWQPPILGDVWSRTAKLCANVEQQRVQLLDVQQQGQREWQGPAKLPWLPSALAEGRRKWVASRWRGAGGLTATSAEIVTVSAAVDVSSKPKVEPQLKPARRRLRRRRYSNVPLEGSMEDMPPPRPKKSEKKKILMLISDTGGGHRASAQAMESMLEQVAPGATDVKIVDVFTHYCPWPYNKFVPGYAVMAKNPWMWKYSWHASNSIKPWRDFSTWSTYVRCKSGFRRLFEEEKPDLVVSLHPLTNEMAINVLDTMAGGKGKRTTPFATIVTDLGAAHRWWFTKHCDACFIPSTAIRKVAKRCGLGVEQIRQYGLPVRPSFWQAPRSRDELVNELGLDADRKTVLIVGGGDGIGSLGKQVEAMAHELGTSLPNGAQIVAVCGKNDVLKAELEATTFENVDVQVCSAPTRAGSVSGWGSVRRRVARRHSWPLPPPCSSRSCSSRSCSSRSCRPLLTARFPASSSLPPPPLSRSVHRRRP